MISTKHPWVVQTIMSQHKVITCWRKQRLAPEAGCLASTPVQLAVPFSKSLKLMSLYKHVWDGYRAYQTFSSWDEGREITNSKLALATRWVWAQPKTHKTVSQAKRRKEKDMNGQKEFQLNGRYQDNWTSCRKQLNCSIKEEWNRVKG